MFFLSILSCFSLLWNLLNVQNLFLYVYKLYVYINTSKSDYFLDASIIVSFFFVLYTILIKFVITVLKLQSIKYLIKCFTVNTIYFHGGKK